jgi:Zn finger protein HypA/HybF involved in hydrogenase expression
MAQLTRNAARCKKCGDVIESTDRHEFVTCTCKSISVDGGLAYLRRVASDWELVEELSEYAPTTSEEGDTLSPQEEATMYQEITATAADFDGYGPFNVPLICPDCDTELDKFQFGYVCELCGSSFQPRGRGQVIRLSKANPNGVTVV